MTGSAQNSLKSSDDEARIAISPYIDPNLGFNSQVQKQLLNKMDKILTEQGIAGYGNQIAKIVERINVVVKDWQKKETKSVELEDVNFYKNALKVRMNEYDKMIDITIKKLKQAKKSKK